MKPIESNSPSPLPPFLLSLSASQNEISRWKVLISYISIWRWFTFCSTHNARIKIRGLHIYWNIVRTFQVPILSLFLVWAVAWWRSRITCPMWPSLPSEVFSTKKPFTPLIIVCFGMYSGGLPCLPPDWNGLLHLVSCWSRLRASPTPAKAYETRLLWTLLLAAYIRLCICRLWVSVAFYRCFGAIPNPITPCWQDVWVVRDCILEQLLVLICS